MDEERPASGGREILYMSAGKQVGYYSFYYPIGIDERKKGRERILDGQKLTEEAPKYFANNWILNKGTKIISWLNTFLHKKEKRIKYNARFTMGLSKPREE